MKIYLVQPPIEDFYATPIRNIPHGLLSLAATLKEHEVHLLDMRFGQRQTIDPPRQLCPMIKFYRPEDASPFGLYKSYYRFGLSISAMRPILPADCDVYLISSLFTTYAVTVYELIHLIRESAPRAKIIVGGAHATILPDEVLSNGADFVIRGEGEVALPQLLAELEKDCPDFKNISNLSWRNPAGISVHNSVHYIENLDALPFADYQIPGGPACFFRKKPHAMLITSRGCPHRCEFCCIHQTMGSRYRVRSVENVLAEMAEKVSQGFRSFDFEDDHLGGNRPWFTDLLNGIQERFAGLDLSLHAMNGITATNLDNEILTAMWRTGFRSLNLALVTPSEARQKHIRRPFGTGKYLEVVASAQRLGFFITTYLIIGLPGDRAEDLLASILFLAPLPTLIGPALFYLVPGTASFRHYADRQQVPDSPLCYRSSFYPIDSEECNRLAAMTLFRIGRILNFMRAVIDADPQPRIQVNSATIFPEAGMSAPEVQRNLGLGLLQLLFRQRKIYGTGRKRAGGYPVIEEECDSQLLGLFLETDWQISGLRRAKTLSKNEFRERYLNL